MRRSRAAIAIVALASLLLPSLAPPVLAQDEAAEHARTLAYWTPQRIANARPRDFIRTPSGQFEPEKGKPPGAGGGGGANVTGASWTKGGAVLPTTGKVVFTLDSGDYICSGTTVADGVSNRSIVVSAAHCAWDGADGGFATNWMFIPEFDTTPTYSCSVAKWGCFTASALVVHDGFTSAGGFNDQAVQYDWSFAVITTAGNKYASPEIAGSFDLDPSPMTTGAQTYAFGYPAAGKYNGRDLVYCSDQVFSDPLVDNLTYGIDCGMTGGSSGGSWLSSFSESTGVGTVRAVTSYGYSGVKKLYASKFSANTANTLNAATTATSNTIVN